MNVVMLFCDSLLLLTCSVTLQRAKAPPARAKRHGTHRLASEGSPEIVVLKGHRVSLLFGQLKTTDAYKGQLAPCLYSGPTARTNDAICNIYGLVLAHVAAVGVRRTTGLIVSNS